MCFSAFKKLYTWGPITALPSVFNGPGYLPKRWRPDEEENTKYLQFCNICLGYKAPRSHHCKKCDRCVLKMDHHCPWINTCVGFKNHPNFILFIFFAVVACIQSTTILSCSLYRALNRGWYLHYGRGTEPIVTLELYGSIACIIALGLSIGVVLGVGILLFFQIRAIMRNRTGIEDWILEKAIHRRLVAQEKGGAMEPFIYPYHLGVWRNIQQVINWDMTPVGDGINWPIVSHPKCDQYTFTREQMEQKVEKKQRAKAYSVVKSYSGRWLPLKFGWRVLCTLPCTDEARIPLDEGDYMLVTRWRKNWLFGEKINGQGDQVRLKGWFPRVCVIEVSGDKQVNFSNDKKEQ
ncbi:hypothetical protein RUM44_004163 [Polyplax serrata]|uniref:Palmitoyltransferase n=1 Tax=Polyplax serrata TaxID=468196 RepID=A0ABR1B2R0_POLSC